MTNLIDQTGLKSFHIQKIEEWTGLKCGEIIFDSRINKWSQKESELNKLILGRKQFIVIITTEKGEIFGGYIDEEIKKELKEDAIEYNDIIRFRSTEKKSFMFSLETNGRIQQPLKIEMGDISENSTISVSIDIENDDKWLLFGCGEIQINKEEVKQFSCVVDFEDEIEERHHGYSKPFCDGEYDDGMLNYTPKNFFFIQMK